MSGNIELQNLRTEVRRRADMEDSTFVTDAELNNYINASVGELYDLIIQKYGSDYYVSSSTINVVSGTDSYSLPSDFYKLLGVDLVVDSDRSIALKRFMFNERNKTIRWDRSSTYKFRYRLQGDNLVLSPEPEGAETLKLWYIPLPATLTNDTDELKGFSGWEEYVIIDAAMKCLQKEESDVSVLFAQKQAMIQRIEVAAENRDANEASRITDVSTDSYLNDEIDYLWRY